MKTGVLGYGKMGKAVERIARERGHTVVILPRSEDAVPALNGLDCAIDFTHASAATGLIRCCIDAGLPVVSGSTGWADVLPEVEDYCRQKGGAMLWAPNFSIGMQITFILNQFLAELMNKRPEYDPDISETHHTEKRDAPSGTAIALAGQITRTLDRKHRWTLVLPDDPDAIPADVLAVRAFRERDVRGEHRVSYRGPHDVISLEHEAFSRDGFALGAVLAAEWLKGRTGVYTFENVLNDMFAGQKKPAPRG